MNVSNYFSNTHFTVKKHCLEYESYIVRTLYNYLSTIITELHKNNQINYSFVNSYLFDHLSFFTRRSRVFKPLSVTYNYC